MAEKLSKNEQLRAQRRGFVRFVEAERDRLERGVFDRENEDHVAANIAEYEQKIESISDELAGSDVDQLLDQEREEIDVEDLYVDDADAQSEGFDTVEEGNEHNRKFSEELNYEGNSGARVECRVVEDLASEGLTKEMIYAVAEEYEQLQDEVCRMSGVTPIPKMNFYPAKKHREP